MAPTLVLPPNFISQACLQAVPIHELIIPPSLRIQTNNADPFLSSPIPRLRTRSLHRNTGFTSAIILTANPRVTSAEQLPKPYAGFSRTLSARALCIQRVVPQTRFI